MENTKQSNVTYKWVTGDEGIADNSRHFDHLKDEVFMFGVAVFCFGLVFRRTKLPFTILYK